MTLRYFLKLLRVQILIRGLKLSVPPPDFQDGERDWRLNQSTTANDLINHAYVMKSHKNPKVLSLESFNVGEPKCFHVPPCWVANSIGIKDPLLGTWAYVCLHMTVNLYSYNCKLYSLISFVIN